jgi:sRNA-binding regulator protein Hfq
MAMKPNDSSMTLRQRYEAQKTTPATKPIAAKAQSTFPSYLRDDSFLGELVGSPITVTFMNGEGAAGILNAFYRFAIKLDDGRIIFKHSIQTVQPTERVPAPHRVEQELEETTETVLH